MDASDLIKALQMTLRGGARPHMENEAVLDRMQERLAKRPEVLNQRRETVEHPFGSIKQWMNQGAFLMRGLEKVRGEVSLTALAYNLRRVLNLVGFADLMTAVRRCRHAGHRCPPSRGSGGATTATRGHTFPREQRRRPSAGWPRRGWQDRR